MIVRIRREPLTCRIEVAGDRFLECVRCVEFGNASRAAERIPNIVEPNHFAVCGIEERDAEASEIEWARAYFLARMRDLPREHFRVLLLNRRHRIIEDFLADEGTVHGAVPSVREIRARAIQGGASALIAAHNHPAGSPDPSAEDIAWTRQLVAAAEPLEICVLDHLIVTHDQVTSMAEIGLLKKLQVAAKRAAEPIGDTH